MLKKWCDIKLNEKTNLVEVYFHNKMIFDGNWKTPELFRLEFIDNDLINIEKLNLE